MRNCVTCNTQFDNRKIKRATCSYSCEKARRSAAGLTPEPPRKLFKGTCEFCGNEYQGNSKRACSRVCGVKLAMREGRWKTPKRYREHNWNWTGGRRATEAGYVMVLAPLDHPIRRKPKSRPYIMEHRLVMEHHLGRYLEAWEWVHHRNGVKDDNRIENLELVTHADHRGEITCPHCLKPFSLH